MLKQGRRTFRSPSAGAVRLDSERGVLFAEVNAVHSNSKWSSLIDAIRRARTVSVISIHGFRNVAPAHHSSKHYSKSRPEKSKRDDELQAVTKRDNLANGTTATSREDLATANDQQTTELCIALAEILRSSEMLRCLHIHGLRLPHAAMRELANGVRDARSLDELSLASCPIGDSGVRALCSALRTPLKEKTRASRPSSLRVLDVSDTQTTARAAEYLAELVTLQAQAPRGLRRLTLNDNPRIGDAGVRALCEAVMRSPGSGVRALDLLNVGATDQIGSLALATLGRDGDSAGDASSLEILDLRSNNAVSRETLRAVLKKALRNTAHATKLKPLAADAKLHGEFAWTDVRSKRQCVCTGLEGDTANRRIKKHADLREPTRSQSLANVRAPQIELDSEEDGLGEVLRFARDSDTNKNTTADNGRARPKTQATVASVSTSSRRGRVSRVQRSRSEPTLRPTDSPPARPSPALAVAGAAQSSPSVTRKTDSNQLRHNLAELDRRIASLRDENAALKSELASMHTVAARVRFVRDSRLLDTLADAFGHLETLLNTIERERGRSQISGANTESARRVLRDARRLCGLGSPSHSPTRP